MRLLQTSRINIVYAHNQNKTEKQQTNTKQHGSTTLQHLKRSAGLSHFQLLCITTIFIIHSCITISSTNTFIHSYITSIHTFITNVIILSTYTLFFSFLLLQGRDNLFKLFLCSSRALTTASMEVIIAFLYMEEEDTFLGEGTFLEGPVMSASCLPSNSLK
jgi:hypothetical protein